MQTRSVIRPTRSVCVSEIWIPLIRPSAYFCPRRPSLLQAGGVIPWMTEMDLPSLHLQRDWAISVRKGGISRCFASVTSTLTRWPWCTVRSWSEILKLYLHTKMNFPGQGFQKLEHYKQTDTESGATERINTPHSGMEIIIGGPLHHGPYPTRLLGGSCPNLPTLLRSHQCLKWSARSDGLSWW